MASSSFTNALAVLLAALSLLDYVNAGVINPGISPFKRDNATPGPRIAVLGDSYGSGLAYLDSNRYQNTNADNCYRWNQAYAAQLETDTDDFLGPADMQFVACTGNRLVNMASQAPQISQITGEVDLIVLTVGGNDAHFYDVASSCIFHDKFPHDYGAQYPDETGECFQSIESASEYITSTVRLPGASLQFDIRATYDDLLQADVYKGLPHTYHTGYIQFFNNDTEGDWCQASGETFGIVPLFEVQPVLTNAVRSRINQLVDDFNNVLKSVIAGYADKNFAYLEISDGFEGHRYCEPGSNHFKQYYDPNVWLWNVSPPFSDSVESMITQLQNDTAQLEKIYPTGLWNTTTTDNRDYFPESGTTGAGWTLRPMHPKQGGYTAIKAAIIAQMQADKIAGVKQ